MFTSLCSAMATKQVLGLFKIYQKLADIVKEKSVGGAAGSAGGAGKDKKGRGRGSATGR